MSNNLKNSTTAAITNTKCHNVFSSCMKRVVVTVCEIVHSR